MNGEMRAVKGIAIVERNHATGIFASRKVEQGLLPGEDDPGSGAVAVSPARRVAAPLP